MQRKQKASTYSHVNTARSHLEGTKSLSKTHVKIVQLDHNFCTIKTLHVEIRGLRCCRADMRATSSKSTRMHLRTVSRRMGMIHVEKRARRGWCATDADNIVIQLRTRTQNDVPMGIGVGPTFLVSTLSRSAFQTTSAYVGTGRESVVRSGRKTTSCLPLGTDRLTSSEGGLRIS